MEAVEGADNALPTPGGHVYIHIHTRPLPWATHRLSVATLGRARRAQEWEDGKEGEGREAGGLRGWAISLQLGAVPCAYVLALSL
jgi:hypothetical protein